MTEENNNLKLWDSVSTTDPDYTKKVTFGRTFTAIDAHSQIMAATKQFGPIGVGWGYRTKFGFYQTIRGEDFVWCDLSLWFTVPQEWEGMVSPSKVCKFGPIRGMSAIQGIKADGKPKPSDNDASKKAMTDALTKGLSHLGFNADVFLGKFDDNKYVAELNKEKSKENIAAQETYAKKRAEFIKEIQNSKSIDGIDIVHDNYREWIKTLEPATVLELNQWVGKQKKEFKNGSK